MSLLSEITLSIGISPATTLTRTRFNMRVLHLLFWVTSALAKQIVYQKILVTEEKLEVNSTLTRVGMVAQCAAKCSAMRDHCHGFRLATIPAFLHNS